MARSGRTGWAAAVLLGCVATAACTGGGSSLSAEDFRPGTCRQAAQPVITADSEVRSLQDGDGDRAKAAAALTRAQAKLLALRASAEPDVEPRVAALTNAIGILRIGVDTGTYSAQQAGAVRTAVAEVASSCRI